MGSLHPEAEVHGVEVDREERVIAVGEWIKDDTGGLGCCQLGFCLLQLTVQEMGSSGEGEDPCRDFVLNIASAQTPRKVTAKWLPGFLEWHGFLKKDLIWQFGEICKLAD